MLLKEGQGLWGRSSRSPGTGRAGPTRRRKRMSPCSCLSVCPGALPASSVLLPPHRFSPSFSLSILVLSLSSSLPPSLSLSRAQRPGQAPLPWPSCSSGPGPLTGTSYPPCGLLDSQGPGVPESSLPDPGPPSRVPSSLGSPQTWQDSGWSGERASTEDGEGWTAPGRGHSPGVGGPAGTPWETLPGGKGGLAWPLGGRRGLRPGPGWGTGTGTGLGSPDAAVSAGPRCGAPAWCCRSWH